MTGGVGWDPCAAPIVLRPKAGRFSGMSPTTRVGVMVHVARGEQLPLVPLRGALT